MLSKGKCPADCQVSASGPKVPWFAIYASKVHNQMSKTKQMTIVLDGGKRVKVTINGILFILSNRYVVLINHYDLLMRKKALIIMLSHVFNP